MNEKLSALFENWAGEKPESVFPLPLSGSYRKYYRIHSKNKTAIGVFNPDKKENAAFLEFTRHFLKNDLSVPEVFAENIEDNIYLIRDLGDLTLYDHLRNKRNTAGIPIEVSNIYNNVLEQLPKFQISAGKNLDYSYCYPRNSFDKRSMLWDLNYFKYYFLKLAKISFDEEKLEDDFEELVNFLSEADTDHFMYRDFQSRNIMLIEGQPYFIDYQGGRKGALQYDVASLLYDSKADIPDDLKEELFEHYISTLSTYPGIDTKKFRKYYGGYVLIRLMQAMGAYGFRGYFEKKDHFLKSIPFALNNLEKLLAKNSIDIKIPELRSAFSGILNSEILNKISGSKKSASGLNVRINSFSYRESLPQDDSGNGGGFIFDCRALPNPGRLEEYKNLTGLDREVKDYLESKEETAAFAASVFSIVDQSVENYTERNFTDLMVSFGCTGGQHRSVFFAEKLAAHLKEKFNIKIETVHINLLKKGFIR